MDYESATLASYFHGPALHSPTALAPVRNGSTLDTSQPAQLAHSSPYEPRRFYKHDPFHRSKKEARENGRPVNSERVTKYRLWYVLDSVSIKSLVLVAIGVESRDSHYDYFSLPGIEPPLAGVQNTSAVVEWLKSDLGCAKEVTPKVKGKLKNEIPDWSAAAINDLLDRAGAPVRNGKRAPPGTAVNPRLKRRADDLDAEVPPGPPTVEDPLGQGWTDFKYKKTANTDKGRGTCKFYLIQEDAPERELVVVTGVEPRAGAKSYIYSVAPGIGEGVFRKRSVAEAWIKLHFLGIEEEAAPAQPVEPPPPKVICSVLEQCFGGDAPLAKWATQAASDECRSHAQEAVRLIRLLHCGAAGATPRVAGGAASPETNAFGCGPLRCEASGAAAQLDVLTAQELKEHEDKLLHHLSALDAEEASLGLLEDTGLHALVASLRGCGNQRLKEQADRLCLGWLKLAGAVDDCRRTINKDSSRAPASLEPERSS